MRDNLGNILSGGNCISEEMMLNYIEGNVSSVEQQRIEKHLLECGFCSDALEGLSSSDHLKVRESLKDLDQKIDARLVRPEGKIIQMKRFYRIAAIIALCAVFGGGLYYLLSIKKSERIFTENFTPYRDTANPAVVTTPAVKSELEKDLEKIPSGSTKEEKKKSPKKENPPEFTFDGSTVTVSTDSKKEEEVSSNYSVSAEQKATPAMPPKKDEFDKPAAAGEAQTAKIIVPDSKNPSAGSGNVDENNESSREKKITAKAASKENRLEEVQLSIASTNATDSIIPKSKSLLIKGKKDYEAKNYSDAVIAFQEYLKTDPANTEALFYNGVSQLSLDKYNIAIDLFQSVLKNHPNEFTEAAKWYLSLAYIKTNKLAKAKKLLEDLSGGQSEFKSKAQKTLDELK